LTYQSGYIPLEFAVKLLDLFRSWQNVPRKDLRHHSTEIGAEVLISGAVGNPKIRHHTYQKLVHREAHWFERREVLGWYTREIAQLEQLCQVRARILWLEYGRQWQKLLRERRVDAGIPGARFEFGLQGGHEVIEVAEAVTGS
jgi:hypothetical protein